MRFIYDPESPTPEMSRRNSTALLAKLDDPASVRTLVSLGGAGEPVIVVTAAGCACRCEAHDCASYRRNPVEAPDGAAVIEPRYPVVEWYAEQDA